MALSTMALRTLREAPSPLIGFTHDWRVIWASAGSRSTWCSRDRRIRVAATVAQLAGDTACQITGASILVDGGANA